MIDKAKLRELLERVTPGPWGTSNGTSGGKVIDATGSTVALVLNPYNRKYITAAVNSLPSLLDDLDAKDQEIARLTARCAAMEMVITSNAGRKFFTCGKWSTATRCERIRKHGTSDDTILGTCKQCREWQFDEARFAAKEGD